MPAPTSMVRQGTAEGVMERAGIGGGGGDGEKHTYYDVPMLKKPVWKWEIACYFFLGGMSAGSFILSRLAERFGGAEFSDITRIGAYTAVAAMAPCPPLLIHDLGDPSRFHHMLRVWKPKSAMNLGTWVLSSIAPIAILAVGREVIKHGDQRKVLPLRVARQGERAIQRAAMRRPGLVKVVAGSIGVLADAAGLPLAMLLATYTGVLVSNQATPVWRQNKWLSPLFAVGAMSTGASAIGLVMDFKKNPWEGETKSERAMKHFSSVAHGAELLMFAGYLNSLEPEVRKPFTTGSQKLHTWGTMVGLVAAETLKHAPVSRAAEKWVRGAGHLCSLAAALSMRWAIVFAAHESGDDPRAARRDSKSERSTYDWLDAPAGEPREKTVRALDPKAISTIDPELGMNPRHY